MEKTAEITKYNVYSAALEASDINNHYAATRMGYKNSKVIITGGPAKYDELAFSGAEDELLSNGKFSTNISSGGGSISTTVAHSGSKSLAVAAGQQGFTYEVPVSKLDPVKRDYTIAVWAKASVSDIVNARLYYQIDGQAVASEVPAFQKVAAGWYLLEMKVPSLALLTASTLKVGCKSIGGSGEIYFDDFRFQPFNANSSAYVYDNNSGELTYLLGSNNLFTKFEYDAAGRLTKTYKEVLGKSNVPLINLTQYNYGNMIKQNVTMSKGFQKNNCPANYIGGNVVYTIPVGKYTATTVTEANALALADLNNNGQAYANGETNGMPNGTCNPIIYARVEINNIYNNTYYYGSEYTDETNGDMSINFYSDPQCTNPLVLSEDVEVTINQYFNYWDYYGSYNNSYNVSYIAYTGESSIDLGNMYISYNYSDYNYPYNDYNYSYDFNVINLNNANYIPKPTYYGY